MSRRWRRSLPDQISPAAHLLFSFLGRSPRYRNQGTRHGCDRSLNLGPSSPKEEVVCGGKPNLPLSPTGPTGSLNQPFVAPCLAQVLYGHMIRLEPAKKRQVQATFRWFKDHPRVPHQQVYAKLTSELGRDFVETAWNISRQEMAASQSGHGTGPAQALQVVQAGSASAGAEVNVKEPMPKRRRVDPVGHDGKKVRAIQIPMTLGLACNSGRSRRGSGPTKVIKFQP